MKRTPIKRKTPIKASTKRIAVRRPTRTADVQRYWTQVAALRCCITGREATIHHVHGGSMIGLLQRAGGKKGSDWLVIPLALELHSLGGEAIDGSMGVKAWEAKYGTQLYWLSVTADRIGVDIFSKAGIVRPTGIPKYPTGEQHEH